MITTTFDMPSIKDGTGSLSAESHLPDRPLLGGHDLDDPSQFVTIRRVPILDAHDDDPERGPVDEGMLRRIAANSNSRASRGDFPALILGHTRPKKEKEEIEQPPVVGYATSFHIDDYKGTPCLHCDFHIHKRDASYAKSFPFRSVERLESPEDFIDRIALLRTPPQRDLGALHYAKSDGSENPHSTPRICYARDFPPLGEETTDTTNDTPNDTTNDTPPASDTSPPPTSTSPLKETVPMADQPIDATASPAPADTAAVPPMTIGSMEASQFVALIIEGFRQALHEEAGAPDASDGDQEGDPAAQYEADDAEEGSEPDPATDEDRESYEASEPGPSNTFTPGGTGCTPESEKRRMYEESDRIKRHNYEKDLADQREINELLIQTVSELKHDNRRVLYEKKLIQLESEGYEIDRVDEMESLKLESPTDYEASQEARIRKCYRRSPVGTKTNVAVANFVPAEPVAAPKLMNREQSTLVANYAMQNGVGIPEAKKALNIV